MDEDELRVALSAIELRGRELLRRVLIRDQADRDAIASQLLRYRDERGDDWADIIDMLTMHPDERRKIVRVLGRLRPPTNDRRAGQAGERRGTRPLFASPRDDARPAPLQATSGSCYDMPAAGRPQRVLGSEHTDIGRVPGDDAAGSEA
jgi:hypothetical protein